MPQVAPIVINDGASTPVAHTFSPIGKDEKGVFWFEQTSPAPASVLGAKRIGYKQARVYNSQKQLTGTTKCVYTLMIPTLETISNSSAGILPPPTLAYTEKGRVEFELAERSSAQERKDTRVLFMNLLGHAMAIANLDTMLPSYS